MILNRPKPRHVLLAAVVVACLATGQLSTLQHAVNHPFHKHSVLCDFFLDFEHNTSPLQPSIAVATVIPVDSVSYVTITHPVRRGIAGVFRIRGPPSSLV